MYERSVVCAKKIDLAGVSGIKSEWVKEDFQREVAVMGGLRSNSIVRILGCIIRREEVRTSRGHRDHPLTPPLTHPIIRSS